MPPTPPVNALIDVEVRPGWRLSHERSLYLAEERTLVLADIHWGYADSHRRIGNLLPRWGDTELGQRLRQLIEHYAPARMIWLGDSLHTSAGAPAAEAFLEELSRDVEVVILAGNHDRTWRRATRSDFSLGALYFHHGDRPGAGQPGQLEIIGHLHPAISWRDGAGLRLKVPALVEGPRRVILPSFSDWSSGLAWNERLEEGERLWLISRRKIWPLRS